MEQDRNVEQRSFWGIFRATLNEQRSKGAFWFKGSIKQQLEMAAPPRELGNVLGALRPSGVRSAEQARADEFEASVARFGISQEHLDAKLRHHIRLHHLYYGVGFLALLYGWWFLLNFSLLKSVPCLAVAIGLVINGYLQGFRAWQIQNRQLITLRDALRNPATYLVL